MTLEAAWTAGIVVGIVGSELVRWGFAVAGRRRQADRRAYLLLRGLELEARWRKSIREWQELGNPDRAEECRIEADKLAAENWQLTRGRK